MKKNQFNNLSISYTQKSTQVRHNGYTNRRRCSHAYLLINAEQDERLFATFKHEHILYDQQPESDTLDISEIYMM